VVVYRIATDTGELVITTESDDVEVVVKQGGKLVRIIDTKTNRSITLHSGVYELELKDAGKGLKLNIDTATLTRGETVLATIERVPPGAAQAVTIKPLHHIRGAANLVPGVSPDGRYFLAVRPEFKGFRVWNTESGEPARREVGAFARFTPDAPRSSPAATRPPSV
jgi:hypothetical protein